MPAVEELCKTLRSTTHITTLQHDIYPHIHASSSFVTRDVLSLAASCFCLWITVTFDSWSMIDNRPPSSVFLSPTRRFEGLCYEESLLSYLTSGASSGLGLFVLSVVGLHIRSPAAHGSPREFAQTASGAGPNQRPTSSRLLFTQSICTLIVHKR